MGPRNANCINNPTCFLLPTPHMYVQKKELLKLAVNIGLFCAASLLKVSLYQMKIIREEGYIVKKPDILVLSKLIYTRRLVGSRNQAESSGFSFRID